MHLRSSVLRKPYPAPAVLLHISAVYCTAWTAVAAGGLNPAPEHAPVPLVALAAVYTACFVPLLADSAACSAAYTASPVQSSAEVGPEAGPVPELLHTL